MLVEGRRQARFCEAFEVNAWAREREQFECVTIGTPPAARAGSIESGAAITKLVLKDRKATRTLSRAAICGRRNRSIREKIIGRGIRVLRRWLVGGSDFLCRRRTFPLFHQPACKHGCGIFLHPLVEKSSDLLAKIGNMAEAREFVALQRDSRSREKKLPRRFSFAIGHGGLLEESTLKITAQLVMSMVPEG